MKIEERQKNSYNSTDVIAAVHVLCDVCIQKLFYLTVYLLDLIEFEFPHESRIKLLPLLRYVLMRVSSAFFSLNVYFSLVLNRSPFTCCQDSFSSPVNFIPPSPALSLSLLFFSFCQAYYCSPPTSLARSLASFFSLSRLSSLSFSPSHSFSLCFFLRLFLSFSVSHSLLSLPQSVAQTSN